MQNLIKNRLNGETAGEHHRESRLRKAKHGFRRRVENFSVFITLTTVLVLAGAFSEAFAQSGLDSVWKGVESKGDDIIATMVDAARIGAVIALVALGIVGIITKFNKSIMVWGASIIGGVLVVSFAPALVTWMFEGAS